MNRRGAELLATGPAATRLPASLRSSSPQRGALAFAVGLLGAVCVAVSAHAGETPRTLTVATSGDYAPFSMLGPGGEAGVDSPSDIPPSPWDLGAPASESSGPAAGGPPVASGKQEELRGDRLDGFDVRVAKQFASERGYTLRFVRFRWPELSQHLAAGDFDVAMSGITMKLDRTIAGRFGVPVASAHAVAVTWKGSPVATRADLDRAGRRFAVNAGGYLEQTARRLFPNAEIAAIPDNDAVRMALLDRTYDAVITDDLESASWTASARDAVVIGPLTEDRKAYLFPADRGALEAEFDRWLLAREKDGTLAILRRHYFGEAAEDAAAEPIAALGAAVAERMSLMPAVYDAKRRDNKPIADKQQEAAVLEASLRSVHDAALAADVAEPDTKATRDFFRTLIDMGRGAQERLLDAEQKRRQAAAKDKAQIERAVKAGTDDAAAAKEAAGEEQSDDRDTAAVRDRGPRYDLTGELRPAISRITERIARILVAVDRPVTVSTVRARLGRDVGDQAATDAQLDDLAEAVAKISQRRTKK